MEKNVNCVSLMEACNSALEIILIQAKNDRLCKNAQLKAFDLPNAQYIILTNLENNYDELCDEAEPKAQALGWL